MAKKLNKEQQHEKVEQIRSKERTLEQITSDESDRLINEINKCNAAIAKMQQRVADAQAENRPALEIARLEGLVKLHTDRKNYISGLNVTQLAEQKHTKLIARKKAYLQANNTVTITQI